MMNRQAAEDAGLTVISAFFSTQYSKILFAPSVLNQKALGMKFEILPITDPMTAGPGELIAFKLFFEGQSLTGISIFTNDGQESKTDTNGVAHIAFKNKGTQLLYAKHQTPDESGRQLDYLKFMTFLIFEAKK